jgi:Ca2+-transporting ATPase
MGAFIIVMGVVMSVIAISIGLLGYWLEDPAWRTLLFTTLIFNQIALAVSVRSDEQSIFSLGLFSNRSMVLAVVSTVLLQLLVIYVPFLQQIFDTQPLGLRDLLIIAAASLLVLLAVEIWKWGLRRRTRLSR